VSLLFRLDCVRVHASTKGMPSAGVETLDEDDSYNDNVVSVGRQNPPRAAKLDNRGSKPEIAGRTPRKKVQGGEASLLFHLDCERRMQPPTGGGGQRWINSVDKDDSYNNKGNNIASVRRLKMVHDSNDLTDWASNGPPKTRSTKVPTRSGRDVTVGTVDDDILSSGVLPITSVDAFASKERGHNPDDNKAVGAAAFGMRKVAASAGDGPAAGTRCSADGVFVLALSGNNNVVAASMGQPDGYSRCHKSVKAAGAAFGAHRGVAVA
jgi:hypothetical protein